MLQIATLRGNILHKQGVELCAIWLYVSQIKIALFVLHVFSTYYVDMYKSNIRNQTRMSYA